MMAIILFNTSMFKYDISYHTHITFSKYFARLEGLLRIQAVPINTQSTYGNFGMYVEARW